MTTSVDIRPRIHPRTQTLIRQALGVAEDYTLKDADLRELAMLAKGVNSAVKVSSIPRPAVIEYEEDSATVDEPVLDPLRLQQLSENSKVGADDLWPE